MPWSATSRLRIQHFKRYKIDKIHYNFELDDYADIPRYRNNCKCNKSKVKYEERGNFYL